MQIHSVVSICTARDIEVWEIASRHLIQNIDSQNYCVVVPHDDLEKFKAVSPKSFAVLDEELVLEGIQLSTVRERMPKHNQDRAGWYFQQLLKLGALARCSASDEDLVLIWDADTIPLKKLSFEQDGRLIYFMGHENHRPYFEVIKKLLQIERKVDFSFIAQSFILKKKWLNEFLAELEQISGLRWPEAILGAIDFEEISGFSEYETLGNWLMTRHKDQIAFSTAKWERLGFSKAELHDLDSYQLANPTISFISFEAWDKKLSIGGTIQSTRFFRNGRFGNQIFTYFFLKIAEQKLGLEIRSEKWGGQSIFNLSSHEKPLIGSRLIEFSDAFSVTNTPEQDLAYLDSFSERFGIQNFDVSGYFQYHSKFLVKYKQLFLDTFRVNEALVKDVVSALNSFKTQQSQPVIAIHYRLGDYVEYEKDGSEIFFTSSPDEIANKITQLLEQIGDRKPIIYLGSDDLVRASNALNDRGITHISSKDLITKLNGKDSLAIDFTLFTLADILLISNSSFSFAAAMLNTKCANFFRPRLVDKKFTRFDPWSDQILLMPPRSGLFI